MVLLRERAGRIEILTLNRPEASNALDPELLDALTRSFEELALDDAVRSVILTGAGDRSFCAGMDLRAFSDRRQHDAPPTADAAAGGEGTGGEGTGGEGTGGEGTGDGSRRARPAFSPFPPDFPKPIVAAVNGAAVGGGFELVLECDLVVAAAHARFGLPEVKRGLLPGGGGTLLGTRIPLNLALELALTGELVDADVAARWGLVNRVVPADRLLAEAVKLADLMTSNGPIAVEVTKRLTRRAVVEHAELGWPTEDDIQRVFRSEDAREGARAFVEKRLPRWTGR
jgi:enoyl-CoA hydratase